jgi:hypothetical protein
MKKLGLLLMLFILPLSVSAASVNVKSLDATTEGKTIKYNGEMEDGSVAVMCKLYNGEEEIDYLSSAVDSNKFEGSFTVTSDGTYKVACANYEGGEFKSTDVVVKEETTEEEKKESTPNTYDNILSIVAIAGISLAILVGITLYIRKEVK